MSDMDLLAKAEDYWKGKNESDFIFSHESSLYRAKVNKSGRIKIKEICTGIPSLIGAENKGSIASPHWNYKFKVESKFHNPIEMFFSPNEFSSKYTFKKALMNKVPVLFVGSVGDFEMFIRREMETFDFSEIRQANGNSKV